MIKGRSGTSKTTILLQRAIKAMKSTNDSGIMKDDCGTGSASTSSNRGPTLNPSLVLFVTASPYLASNVDMQYRNLNTNSNSNCNHSNVNNVNDSVFIPPKSFYEITSRFSGLANVSKRFSNTDKYNNDTYYYHGHERDSDKNKIFISLTYVQFLKTLDRSIPDGQYFFGKNGSSSNTNSESDTSSPEFKLGGHQIKSNSENESVLLFQLGDRLSYMNYNSN